MIVLTVSENIKLKQIELSDASALFAIIDGEREYLRKWLPFIDYSKQVSDTEAFIKSNLSVPEEQRELVFVLLYEEKVVGIAGFRDTDKANKKTEIGYWLSEYFQKKGIVTRAVEKLIHYAFNSLDINRIQIRCGVENYPSKGIPKRLGFKPEGIERDGELLVDGNFTDLQVYSLLKKEFEAHV